MNLISLYIIILLYIILLLYYNIINIIKNI